MLTLSRKVEESIIVGNNIEIKILGIQGDNVKIGIEAPKNISIHRKEVYVQIEEANKLATESKNIEKLNDFFKKNR